MIASAATEFESSPVADDAGMWGGFLQKISLDAVDVHSRVAELIVRFGRMVIQEPPEISLSVVTSILLAETVFSKSDNRPVERDKVQL